MQTFKREILSSLLLLVLLAGCAPGPAVRPGAEGPSDPRVEQAISLESTSDYLAAAELYEQIADSKSGPARQRMLLSAARNRLLGQDLEGATAILSGIGISGVEDLDFEARLLTAELALARNRPDDALELLRSPAPENLPIDLLVRYHKDRAKAFRLAGNLLDNACKWCKSRVKLTIRPLDDSAIDNGDMQLIIEDDGPGIPVEAADTLLQRGMRLDESAPGHGIGLAVVKEIAASYGGEIKIDQSPLGGARVAININPSGSD